MNVDPGLHPEIPDEPFADGANPFGCPHNLNVIKESNERFVWEEFRLDGLHRGWEVVRWQTT